MKQISILSIDLAKNSFQLQGNDARGNWILRKKLNRKQLIPFVANLTRCTIAMEACGGAHYWGRIFQSLGHDIRIMAPQFVKPYIGTQKNDVADADGIAEAASRPKVRSVELKTIDQQVIQSIHRVREDAIDHKRRLGNRLHGLLMEFGIVFGQGASALNKQMVQILSSDMDFPPPLLAILRSTYEQWCQAGDLIKGFDRELKQIAHQNKRIKNLIHLRGIGTIVGTAMHVNLGTGNQFKNGRQYSASLGIVPKQHSTGGKPLLLGITKVGDKYLRKQLIHGARSVVNQAEKRTESNDPLDRWINQLLSRKTKNKVVVAVANKIARMAWHIARYGDVPSNSTV